MGYIKYAECSALLTVTELTRDHRRKSSCQSAIDGTVVGLTDYTYMCATIASSKALCTENGTLWFFCVARMCSSGLIVATKIVS